MKTNKKMKNIDRICGVDIMATESFYHTDGVTPEDIGEEVSTTTFDAEKKDTTRVADPNKEDMRGLNKMKFR